jgi:hypothetical protein
MRVGVGRHPELCYRIFRYRKLAHHEDIKGASGRMLYIDSYGEFFEWCAQRDLLGERKIADAFCRTPQTVRNWKRGVGISRGGRPPLHLKLACAGLDAERHAGKGDISKELSWEEFKEWKSMRNLKTYEDVGEAFGLTRQAIHNWHKRGTLPRWLSLVCRGFDEFYKRDLTS